MAPKSEDLPARRKAEPSSQLERSKKMAPNTCELRLRSNCLPPQTSNVENKKCDNFETDLDYTKGSIPLKLGSYKSLAFFAAYFSCLFIWHFLQISLVSEPVNPNAASLPLMKAYGLPEVITGLYISFSLVWGPRLMKNRKSMNIKKYLVFYNSLQVLLCTYIFLAGGIYNWFWHYSWKCEPEDFSETTLNLTRAKIGWLYLFTKFLDFSDTIFFVLMKKWSHISLLHVFHHGNMFYGIFYGIKYIGGGHFTLLCWINSFVHVLLYSYYLLAAMGPALRPYLWWKKYLTQVQLIQFVIIFVHAIVGAYNGCSLRTSAKFVVLTYSAVFFMLFLDFYISSYGKKKSSESDVKNNGGYDSTAIEKPA